MNLSVQYLKHMQPEEVASCYKREISNMEASLSGTHPVVRSLKDVLIQCFTLYGNFSSAEQAINELLELLEKELGPEHLETLACRSNLAQTYRNQGRWKKAEDVLFQIVEMKKRIFSGNHPSVLTSMINLASTYRCLGRYKDAEALELQVMDENKKIFGEHHPSTLGAMANLASTYKEQGVDAEALEGHGDEKHNFRRARSTHIDEHLQPCGNVQRTRAVDQSRGNEAKGPRGQKEDTR
jgi:tetratricopeptide (TPR) repeat protein